MNTSSSGFGFFYGSFDGRVSRSQFWLYNVLLLGPLPWLGLLLDVTLLETDGPGPLFFLTTFGLLFPQWAMCVKRCHDRNRSGWFMLLSFIPIISLWVSVELLFLQGTSGPNTYGDDPVSPLGDDDRAASQVDENDAMTPATL